MGSSLRNLCCALALLAFCQAPALPQDAQEKPAKPPPAGPLDDLPLPPNAIIVIPKDAKQGLELMRPGGIILSPEQYRAILEKMKALEEKLAQMEKKAAPRSEPLMSQCALNGEVAGGVLSLRAELTFKTAAENQLVPVGFRGLRFTEAKLDGETPVWGPDPDRLAILAKEPRVYQLVLQMQIKVAGVGNERRVALELPASAITRLELSFDEPIKNPQVRGRPDPLPISQNAQGRPAVSAHLPVLTQLDLTWQSAAAGAVDPTPDLAVTGDLRILVGEKAIETEALLLLECRRGSVSAARFRLGDRLGDRLGEPDSPIQVLDAAETSERAEKPGLKRVSWRLEGPVLSVTFDPPLTPSERPLALRVQTRQAVPSKAGGRVPLGRIALESPLDKSAQRGTVAVFALPGASVQLQEKDLSTIELRDLPPRPAAREAETVGAFRYWRQPVSLEARIAAAKPVVEARVAQQWHVGETVMQASCELSFEVTRPGVELLEIQWPKELTLDRVSPIALVEHTDIDSAGSIVRLRLARRQHGAFKLRLEGVLATANALEASPLIPVPLRARRDVADADAVPITIASGEESRLSMSDELEVQIAAGTQGVLLGSGRPPDPDAWLREPTPFVFGQIGRETWRLALRWQPRRWAVGSHADVWLTRNALRVRQTLTYSFGAAAPARVLLRVPRTIDSLIKVRDKGLSDRRRVIDAESVERVLLLARGLSGDFRLVLEYELPAPARPDQSTWPIPLVSPSGGVATPSTARVRTSSSLRALPAPGSGWVPVSTGPSAASASGQDLRLSRAGTTDAALGLLCEPAQATATDLVAERVLVEAAIGDSTLRCRTRFQFASVHGEAVELRWQTASESLRLEKAVFHLAPARADAEDSIAGPTSFEPAIHLERLPEQGETVVRIQVEPFLLDRPSVLEVRYQLPAEHARRLGVMTTVPVPRLAGGAAAGQIRWRVELPSSHLPLWNGGDYLPGQAWRWQGWLVPPQPSSLAAEANEWIGSAAGDSSTGDERAAWKFVGLGQLGPLSILHLPRRTLLVACSLVVLIAGLAVYSVGSRAARWVCLGILALSVLGLSLTSLLMPVFYGAQAGLVVLAAILLILWARRQRWRRQVVLLPGFRRVKTGSSLVRASSGEPSTVDAPGNRPSPSSEVRV